MNLFELFVKIGVDDQASDKISNLSNNLGNGLKTAAKIGTAAVASASAGIAALTKSAVDSFAEYEQLAGGAAKIFDEMSQTEILRDAQNAYKDLGMSANQYLAVMNNVGATFAATMGDEAGYETAKTGLKAISDYASGTGKSVDELSSKFTLITRSTASYQSIADQFSGILPATSADFLAQAQAAGILSEKYKQLTEVPIAEYQAAVSEMLERGVSDLGLANNTMEEAFSTLSGSLAMAGSAWNNLVTGLADDSADLDTLVENFVDSVEAAGNNIIPRVEQILVGISNAVVRLAPMIEEKLPGLIEAILPGLISAAGVLVASLAKAIPAMLPPLVDAAMQVIDGIESGLSEKIPALSVIFNNLEVAVAAVVGAMAAYKAQLAISSLISAVTKALNGMTVAQWAAKTAQDALNIALNANPIGIVVTLLGGLAAALVTAYNTSEDFRDKVNAAFNAIKSVVMPVINTVTKALGVLINAFSRAISAAKNFLGIEEKKVEAIADNYDQIADKAEANALIMSNVTKNVEKDVSAFSKGVATVATTAENVISQASSEIKSDAEETEEAMLTTASAVKEAMAALGDSFSYTADETQLQANKMAVLAAAVENAQDDIQRLSYLFDQSVQNTGAASEQTQFLAEQLDRARDNLQSAQKALQDYQKQLDKSAAAQEKFSQSAKNAFSAFEGFGNSLQDVGELIGSDIVSGIGEIIDDMTSGVSTVLNFATSLATLTETLTTLKEAMNALKAAEGVAGIVSSLGNMLGIGAAGAAAGTAVAGTAAAGTAGAAAAGGAGILAVIGEVLSGPVGWALLAAGALGAIGLGIAAATKNKNVSSSSQGASNAIDYRDIQDAYWYGNERAFAGYDFRTDPYIYHQRTSAMNLYQQRMQAQIERLTDLVQEYLPQTANMQMVLDDGTLVGALTPSINSQLGQLEILAERGNI